MRLLLATSLLVLVFAWRVHSATVSLPDGRAGEITTTKTEQKNEENSDKEPNVVARSGFFGYNDLGSFFDQLARNGNDRDRDARAPPTEQCEPISLFPQEQKCRKGSVKDKDKKCDIKECIMQPTVGYTVPPSYFDLFNIPQYYRYMFSKQIVNPNPFGNFGQSGQLGSILQMLMGGQMGGGGQYGYARQGGYPMTQQTGYPMTQQTGYPAMGGQYGYPATGGQTGYPVTNTQAGYPVTDTQTGYPYSQTGAQSGYPATGTQTGYNTYGTQYPSQQQQQQYNPYSQYYGSQFNQQNYQQHQYAYPQATTGWAPHTRSQEISQNGDNNDKNKEKSEGGDKRPTARSFGFDMSMMNYGNYGYNPMQYQRSFQTSGQIVATMCKRANQACQCKTNEDCECKSRRPKLCTQQYTDERRLFYVWEYVAAPSPQAPTYADQQTEGQDGPTFENHDPSVMRSGGENEKTFTAQSHTASYGTPDYQQQQQQQPQGRYVLQQKMLYFKRPSGCECETIKKTQEVSFFG